MRRYVVTLLLFLILGLLVSCAGQPIAYGIVVWPAADSGLSEGELLPILAESEIAATVTLSGQGEEIEVDAWRVMRFETEPAAEEFRLEFADWAESYGRSLRTALPVRERPDRGTTRVYRLREGELVKILDRDDEQSNEAGLVDYWYQVLTTEGISGWAFGYHLDLTGASGRVSEESLEMDAAMELAAEIAGVDWRPEYFDTMMAEGRIVLEEFGPRFGFFGDLDDRRFRLVLPGVRREFSFDTLTMPVSGTVALPDGSLTIRVRGERSIEAQYTVAGRQRASTFVRIEESLTEIVDAERERRNRLLEQLVSRGTGLVSTAFGEMSLSEDGTVSWEGFQRLVPSVLPTGFPGNARITFSLFMGDELRGRHDGVLEMALPGGGSSAFLYSYIDDGLRLTHVPARLVSEEKVVEAEPISPVVMFYRFVDG